MNFPMKLTYSLLLPALFLLNSSGREVTIKSQTLETTLEFEATDKNDIGDHTVTMRASLTNYPEIDPIESIV